MSNSTIFALSTAKGNAGIAVIRISGDSSIKILQEMGSLNNPTPRKMYLSTLSHAGKLLDKSMVVYFKAPNSYTGEDMAELHIHGGTAVINSIIEALRSFDNVRYAEAGEFTKRALYNQKMNIIESEAVMEIVNAQTARQQSQAMKHLLGENENIVSSWREKLIAITALIEACIDFSDEDIPEGTKSSAIEKIKELSQDIEKTLQATRASRLVRDGIKIVLMGEPNVGKSSIFNKISKEDRAIISDIAGTTRDYIEVSLDINGYRVSLIDTAGIRETANTIENEGIKRTLKKIEEAQIVIPILAGNGANQEDFLSNLPGKTKFVIVNKEDKISDKDRENWYNKLSNYGLYPVFTSCITNNGLDNLFNELGKYCDELCKDYDMSLSSSMRHEENIAECLKYLKSAEQEEDIVLLAQLLRFALVSIGKITGNINVEEVLDEVFASFCIGK